LIKYIENQIASRTIPKHFDNYFRTSIKNVGGTFLFFCTSKIKLIPKQTTCSYSCYYNKHKVMYKRIVGLVLIAAVFVSLASSGCIVRMHGHEHDNDHQHHDMGHDHDNH